MREFGNRVTKYVDKPNELDVSFRDLEKKVTDSAFKITATVDMVKGYAETIDNVFDRVKQIDKIIDKFDDKLQQIGKIAHPPAIPLKEIKADIKNLYEITVKLIDSNRQSKDKSDKMYTAMNVIKDILIKFFRNGK